jgi:hypothetical protein
MKHVHVYVLRLLDFCFVLRRIALHLSERGLRVSLLEGSMCTSFLLLERELCKLYLHFTATRFKEKFFATIFNCGAK